MTKQMEMTAVLLKLAPTMLSTESDVQALVMADAIDFETGMQLQDSIANRKSNENEDLDVNAPEKEVVPAKAAGAVLFEGSETFKAPDAATAVVIKATLNAAGKEQADAILNLIDKLNVEFQGAYNKNRAEIFRSIKQVVEITGPDNAVAKDIADVLKKENLLFINK